MQRTSGSSESVTTIINVIEDIAIQTNLPALNAGVEAARTGSGFAVVASKVCALPQRSTDAAREISSLPSQSSEHTRHRVELVDQTGTFIQSIAKSITTISENMTEIAGAVEEQTTCLQEINAATTRLYSATLANASAFEQTAASTNSLSREACTHAFAVTRFKLDEAGSDAATARRNVARTRVEGSAPPSASPCDYAAAKTLNNSLAFWPRATNSPQKSEN